MSKEKLISRDEVEGVILRAIKRASDVLCSNADDITRAVNDARYAALLAVYKAVVDLPNVSEVERTEDAIWKWVGSLDLANIDAPPAERTSEWEYIEPEQVLQRTVIGGLALLLRYRCKNCGYLSFSETNYCPECGRRMESD